jgi:hypothetical protein
VTTDERIARIEDPFGAVGAISGEVRWLIAELRRAREALREIRNNEHPGSWIRSVADAALGDQPPPPPDELAAARDRREQEGLPQIETTADDHGISMTFDLEGPPPRRKR